MNITDIIGINTFELKYLSMKKIFLGLGSNLGERLKNLEDSMTMIGESVGKIDPVSSVYQTEPWGFESENQFLNMVIGAETDLSPSELLGKILMVESHLGRKRYGKKYSSRIIDIDILLYDNGIIDDKALKIPHPHLHERKFVLVPLAEIAPDLIHPIFRKSITSLLITCQDNGKVILFNK
jgi:2-amino-4-hydroxy-6-hydroxymethyldihydropteridine diphosphokinase